MRASQVSLRARIVVEYRNGAYISAAQKRCCSRDISRTTYLLACFGNFPISITYLSGNDCAPRHMLTVIPLPNSAHRTELPHLERIIDLGGFIMHLTEEF